jgi:STE24 endopeptidase
VLGTYAAAQETFAVPETSAAVRAWSRQRDLLWVAEQAAVLSMFAAFLFSGLGARLAAALGKLARGGRLLTAALLAGAYALLASAVALPLSVAGQVLAAPLGLAAPDWAGWFVAKSSEIAALIAGASLLGWAAYWLFAKAPVFWPVWMATGAIGATAMSLAAQPMAHELRPVDPPLAAIIAKMAARAGAPAPRAAVRVTSRDGPCGGATVLGLGPTKVLAVDTGLLRHHPRAEIEQAIAHELKHYIGGDDRKALLAAILIIVAGFGTLFFGSTLAVRISRGRWGFSRLADPASLPLLLLIGACFNLAATAGFRAYGRDLEQQADRFSLELTRDKSAQAALLLRLLRCSHLKNRISHGFRERSGRITRRCGILCRQHAITDIRPRRMQDRYAGCVGI